MVFCVFILFEFFFCTPSHRPSSASPSFRFSTFSLSSCASEVRCKVHVPYRGSHSGKTASAHDLEDFVHPSASQFTFFEYDSGRDDATREFLRFFAAVSSVKLYDDEDGVDDDNDIDETD